MNGVKAVQVSCCPECGRKAKARGRNGLILCSMDGWVKESKSIEIIKYNN